MNLSLIFLTGLTSGGISCVAVQGGLLASLIANQGSGNIKTKIGGFLVAKLLGYTLLGAALGFIGTAFQLSLTWLLFFQAIAAIYLLASAFNLLEVHPVFRHVVLKPPKWLFRLVKQSSKMTDWFAPLILGFFTILIPCGVTQAMEVNAISSGGPVNGALIMAAFVIGTMPLFILVGMLSASLSTLWQQRLNKATAVLLIVLSIYSLNGILTVVDSPLSIDGLRGTYQKLQQFEKGQVQGSTLSTPVIDGSQHVEIDITPKGYKPEYFQVKKGIPVQLTLITKENYTCANYFVFKAFNISARMQPSETRVFNFIPDKTGRYTFSCSMGMYRGVMEVI